MSCTDLLVAERFEEAQAACRREFEASGDPVRLDNWIAAAGESGDLEGIQQAVETVPPSALNGRALLQAGTYLQRGNRLPVAQGLLERSLDLLRQADDHAGVSRAHRGLYTIAWQRSNHRVALQSAAASLDAARAASDEELEMLALASLFNIFEEVGSLGAAQATLTLLNAKMTPSSGGARINAMISQGLLYLNQRRLRLALNEFEQALEAASGSNNRAGLRGLHLNLVHAHLELDQLEEAQRHMDLAWDYANPDGSVRFALGYYQSKLNLKAGRPAQAYTDMLDALSDPNLPQVWRWEMQYWLARAANATDRPSAAIAALERSVESLESLREQLGYSELKSHLLDRKRAPYELLFTVLADEGDATKAFEVSEQAKSRSFIDAFIAETTVESDSLESSFPLILADRLDAVRTYVAELRTSPTVAVDSWREMTVGLGEATVVSYFVTDERIFALAVTAGDVAVRELGSSTADLEALLSEYRQDADDRDVATRLGYLLLPEALLPAPGRHLFIAPDALLGEVAFPGLLVNERFLIERHPISLVPSASALVTMSQSGTDSMGSEAFRVIGDAKGDLPSARQEIEMVADLLGAEPFIGPDANRESLLRVRQPTVLHLATHSGVGNLGPWLTLADDQIAGVDILKEQLKPRLAVLASCASGAGVGDNLWGSLGGAFLSAGTPDVLVSLWSIEDDTARDVMGDFYSHLTRNETPSQALRSAQLNAIARGLEPSQWSNFVVMGGSSELRGGAAK